MMDFELQLKRQPATLRNAVAWFIAGGDPAAWVAEICQWGAAQETMRLFIVRAAPGDRQARGLFVIPSADARPRAAHAFPLGILEGNLYLPVDAELFPPLTPSELRQRFQSDATLFHPGIGLVAFTAADALGMWDLLAAPALAEANWNAARAGSSLNSRLAGIALAAMPRMGDIFGDAAKEIGSEPMGKLKPQAGEPSAGLGGKARRAVSGWTASAAGKLFSMFPAGGGRRTWINDVMDWAAAKLTKVTEELEILRHQELNRLMRLLESDPEAGLRHALPLAGAPGRGRANPGAQLGARDIRFNAGRLGGGRPTDHWDVPSDLRQKLIARYRELALLEKQLGRYQRSAYIYAELLGDLSAAAAVLKEGRRFADAAILYRDHLGQPRAAAECFVEGGLFAEALAIYEKEKDYIALGDLYRKLDSEKEAVSAFMEAISQKKDAFDFIGAAWIFEERLEDPDGALLTLQLGWPDKPQADLCLRAEFDLLGRLGRHDTASKRLTELREEATPAPKILALAKVLRGIQESYPHEPAKRSAADLARVKLSGRLANGDASDARAGTEILGSLAREDRLLARDASRFLSARLDALARKTPPPLPTASRKPGSGRVGPPEVVRVFTLPKATAVSCAKRAGEHFVAAIRRHSHIFLLRGDWNGVLQELHWAFDDSGKKVASPILDEQLSRPDRIMMTAAAGDGVVEHVLQPVSQFSYPLHIVAPLWLPRGVIAASISAGQYWLLRFSSTDLIAEARSDQGKIIGNFKLPDEVRMMAEDIEQRQPARGGISMLAMRSNIWIAVGQKLYCFSGRSTWKEWNFEEEVFGLEQSSPFLSRAVVVRCRSGAAVFWVDQISATPEIIAPKLVAPLAAFLRNGSLVLLSTTAGPEGFAGQVIDLDRRGIHSTADFAWKGDWPVAIVATDQTDGFAIFTKYGEVAVFRAPVVG